MPKREGGPSGRKHINLLWCAFATTFSLLFLKVPLTVTKCLLLKHPQAPRPSRRQICCHLRGHPWAIDLLRRPLPHQPLHLLLRAPARAWVRVAPQGCSRTHHLREAWVTLAHIRRRFTVIPLLCQHSLRPLKISPWARKSEHVYGRGVPHPTSSFRSHPLR